MPLDVARRLNIAYDPNNVRVGFGAGGPFTEQQAAGDVVVSSEIGPIVLRQPSINATLPFILLGRRDFFEERRICFDQRRGRMEIEPV